MTLACLENSVRVIVWRAGRQRAAWKFNRMLCLKRYRQPSRHLSHSIEHRFTTDVAYQGHEML